MIYKTIILIMISDTGGWVTKIQIKKTYLFGFEISRTQKTLDKSY